MASNGTSGPIIYCLQRFKGGGCLATHFTTYPLPTPDQPLMQVGKSAIWMNHNSHDEHTKWMYACRKQLMTHNMGVVMIFKVGVGGLKITVHKVTEFDQWSLSCLHIVHNIEPENWGGGDFSSQSPPVPTPLHNLGHAHARAAQFVAVTCW